MSSYADIEPTRMACGCCTIVKLADEVDKWALQCIPAHTTMPEPHTGNKDYRCLSTGCESYQPAHKPAINQSGYAIWPICVCGELAQEHV